MKITITRESSIYVVYVRYTDRILCKSLETARSIARGMENGIIIASPAIFKDSIEIVEEL